MFPRTIALGDLHLVKETPRAVVQDFISLVKANAGSRIVIAGDLFDLSADHPGTSKQEALRRAFESLPEVQVCLRQHLEQAGELWLLAGNHDSALAEVGAEEMVGTALSLTPQTRKRLRSSPWFLRDEGVHFEHGHLFDPDNATDHPLAADLRSLGVRFVEDFIAPTGAFRYLNANDGTPLKLLVSAFTWYKWRGPYVVFKYFDTAFRAVLSSGPFRNGSTDQELGRAREADFFASNVDDPSLRALLSLVARPTMSSLPETLSRLYLDRVAATCALMSGIGLIAAGKRKEAQWLLGLGGLAMGLSWALGHDRYGGSVPERLREGAQAIRAVTPTKLVVMGHAHREASDAGYANTGSFAFPRGAPGRPYLELSKRASAPVAERRYWAGT